MNIFSKAVDHIKFSIPREVLRITFQEDMVNWRAAPESLDSQIMLKVIKPRVLVDANIVGGVQAVIPLNGLTPLYTDRYTVVYEIPMNLTNNRNIISILSVGYLPYGGMFNSMAGGGTVVPTSMSDFGSAGMRVGDSHSAIPHVASASADLVGYNTVMIRDPSRITGTYQLRCMVSNDANMNNINPRSYLNFAELCLHAVQAYIYNTLIVKLDQAYLQGGQEMGSVKAYVESLADANENYMTYLREVWQKVAVMSDKVTHQRYLKTMISPAI